VGESASSSAGRDDLAASPRLFRSGLLDKMSRVHHLVPLVVYTPIAAGLLYFAFRSLSVAKTVALCLAGYFIWTLVEYLGHRFLFHSHPRTMIGRRVHFLIHGVHHEHPNDPLRLVMPPLMSVPIMATAYGVLRLTFGQDLVLPVLAGFIVGYVGYDMLHFHVHHRRPRTRLGQLLRYRHMHHHFRDEKCWFGVSAPWWDVIFATLPDGARPPV
jgi:dihydroceramide fatty acyl 2-hydroxylase